MIMINYGHLNILIFIVMPMVSVQFKVAAEMKWLRERRKALDHIVMNKSNRRFVATKFRKILRRILLSLYKFRKGEWECQMGRHIVLVPFIIIGKAVPQTIFTHTKNTSNAKHLSKRYRRKKLIWCRHCGVCDPGIIGQFKHCGKLLLLFMGLRIYNRIFN